MRNSIMPDSSEVIRYDEPGIPLYIAGGVLSGYPDMRYACHWHEDFEFIRILEGGMYYSIDGKRITLEQGDCLFVNAKKLHYGFDISRKECLFTCILIHPALLCANPTVFKDLIDPIASCEELPYLVFSKDEPEYEAVSEALDEVWRLKQFRQEGYELLAISQLLKLIPPILRRARAVEDKGSLIRRDPRLYAQKQMVAYIAQNYMLEISLEDIASSANVSVSTCCRIFKAYIHQTPIEFLNSYRLKVCAGLLEDTDQSITQIATSCGFNHTSYFSEIFLKNYGCTPSQYRKMHQ